MYSSQSMQQTERATVAVIATILFGTGSIYGLDRTEAWRQYIQPRVPFILDAATSHPVDAERPDVRTVAEHIENIRKVLNPAIADLAGLFEVSRQAVYKWLSSNSTPEPEKFHRIVELSKIADAFRSAQVSRAGTLLKMKAFAGRSLLELIQSGENRREHIAALIREARTMEASYQQSGLATSKSRATNDWQSAISIPGTPEHA